MKKQIYYNLLLFMVYMLLAYCIPEIVSIEPTDILLILGLPFILGLCFIEKHFSKNKSQLTDSIIKYMSNKGYIIEKNEGFLIYRLNGRTYKAFLWEMGNRVFRTEVIDFTEFDEWDKISAEGKALIADYVNQECPYTTCVVTLKGMAFSHITAIQTVEDFLFIAKSSYDLIGKAVNLTEKMVGTAQAAYSTKETNNHIGFNYNHQ